VRVGEGRVLTCERGLDPDASAEAVGELDPWITALIDQWPKRLRSATWLGVCRSPVRRDRPRALRVRLAITASVVCLGRIY